MDVGTIPANIWIYTYMYSRYSHCVIEAAAASNGKFVLSCQVESGPVRFGNISMHPPMLKTKVWRRNEGTMQAAQYATCPRRWYNYSRAGPCWVGRSLKIQVTNLRNVRWGISYHSQVLVNGIHMNSTYWLSKLVIVQFNEQDGERRLYAESSSSTTLYS